MGYFKSMLGNNVFALGASVSIAASNQRVVSKSISPYTTAQMQDQAYRSLLHICKNTRRLTGKLANVTNMTSA